MAKPRVQKRGAGRPPLGKGVVRINFKLPIADREKWHAAADREDMTLSEWLRAAAEMAIARGSTR